MSTGPAVRAAAFGGRSLWSRPAVRELAGSAGWIVVGSHVADIGWELRGWWRCLSGHKHV